MKFRWGKIKSQIIAGLIILAPIYVLLMLLGFILQPLVFTVGQAWKYIFGPTPWIALLPITIIFTLIFAYIIGSEKLGLTKLIDKISKKIPLLRTIWREKREAGTKQSMDLSRFPAVLVNIAEIWTQGFIVGKARSKDGLWVKILIPNSPLPVTGFIIYRKEEDLNNPEKILLLKNSPSEFIQMHLSLGLSGPEELKYE